MKKKQNINIRALLLLLIYIFSNSPAIIFHHHNNEIVAYEKATSCEKVVFYNYNSEKCTHKTHITKAFIKCSLCDNHNLTAHFLAIPFFNFSKVKFNNLHFTNVVGLISYYTSETSNRGPPTV